MSLHRIGGTATKIMCLVADDAGYHPAEIKGPRRYRKLAETRQLVMWLIWRETSYSYEVIGRVLGKRDHSTVCHAVSAMNRRMAENEALKVKAERLRSMIRTAPWFPAQQDAA